MKNNPKRRCEKREASGKGMFSSLQSLWVVIIAFLLGLAAKEKIYKYDLYYNVINNITI